MDKTEGSCKRQVMACFDAQNGRCLWRPHPDCPQHEVVEVPYEVTQTYVYKILKNSGLFSTRYLIGWLVCGGYSEMATEITDIMAKYNGGCIGVQDGICRKP